MSSVDAVIWISCNSSGIVDGGILFAFTLSVSYAGTACSFEEFSAHDLKFSGGLCEKWGQDSRLTLLLLWTLSSLACNICFGAFFFSQNSLT